MRRIKRLVTDFICCRLNKSTILIITLGTLFILGNYLILSRFYSNPNKPDYNYPTPWTLKRTGTEIRKQLNGNGLDGDELFHKKFEDYRKQEEQEEFNFKEFKELPPDKPERNFNVHIQTLKPVTKIAVKKVPKIDGKSEIHSDNGAAKIALVVIACNRPAVGRCLDHIFKYKPTSVNISVIVSQDCGHEATANVIKSYGDRLIHLKQPNLGDVPNVPANMKRFMGYYKISRHFKFALGTVFSKYLVDSVIIVEDDIDIAPDFFDYFLATRPLLDKDESIYCISAWNDNGKSDSIDETAIDLLYRSDFFPGLGWLITRKLWQEIGPNWPLGFWDDWMRAPATRKGRVCIRPEISRTKTFGRVGVSQGQFYDQYLKYIKLNSQPYPFEDYDLTYLLKDKYDKKFLDIVYSSPEKQLTDILDNNDHSEETVRITYRNNGEFTMLSRRFGIMTDLKAGIPRTAYKGVVTFFRNNKRIYIAPPKDWKGYVEHRK